MSLNNLTTEQFISKARLVHGGNYDYSKTTYLSSLSKVDIICSVHGLFSQIAGNHLQGRGCNACGKQLMAQALKESAKTKRIDISEVVAPDGAKAVSIASGEYTLVDAEDYERVSQYNWSLANGYVVTNINGKGVRLHRFVMDVTDPEILVDHKFHNKLDNRKNQLRICTNAQNVINRVSSKNTSSKYKGVCWDKNCNRWMAQISYEGVKYYLGRFTNEIDAALAYDKKAKELHGEFAHLNLK